MMAALGAMALLAGCGVAISWALAPKRGAYRSRVILEHLMQKESADTEVIANSGAAERHKDG